MKYSILFLLFINISSCIDIDSSEPFDAVIGLYQGLASNDFNSLKFYMTDSSYQKLAHNFSYCSTFPKNVKVQLIQDSIIDISTHSLVYYEIVSNKTTIAKMIIKYSNHHWRADVFTRKQIVK